MKYAIKLAAVTVVGLGSVARADHAIEGATGSAEIINNCQKTVYLHSVGDSDGPEHVIPPGQSWSERYKQKEGGGGPSLKIRTEGTAIIQFEYSAFPDQVWYNLSCKSSPQIQHDVLLTSTNRRRLLEPGNSLGRPLPLLERLFRRRESRWPAQHPLPDRQELQLRLQVPLR